MSRALRWIRWAAAFSRAIRSASGTLVVGSAVVVWDVTLVVLSSCCSGGWSVGRRRGLRRRHRGVGLTGNRGVSRPVAAEAGVGGRTLMGVAFDGGDRGPLGRAPGLAGEHGGGEPEESITAEHQRRADPADAGVQGGGDQRGEPGDDGGELVGEGGAGGAGAGGEELREPGALDSGEA